MKKQSHSKLIIRSSFALALALVIWTPVQAQSTMPMKDKPMMEGKMMERCQAMMEKKQKMMAKIKEQDTALAAQVVSMNSAPKGEKLDLLAAVVTRMVEQQTAMHARKAKMDKKMMKHMMGHMQMGKESMSQCPMMMGMDEKSAGDHKSHEGKHK